MNDEASELAQRAARQGKAAAKNSGRAASAAAEDIVATVEETVRDNVYVEARVSNPVLLATALVAGVIGTAAVGAGLRQSLRIQKLLADRRAA